MIDSINIYDPENKKWATIDPVKEAHFEPEDEPAFKPASLSTSFSFAPNKEMRKWYRDMNRTMPDRANPRKKRPLRLIRKWFNRYQRQRIIGMTMRCETIDGKYLDAVIIDVKLGYDSHKGVYYNYTSKPII